MKKILRQIGIIALVAVIGFSFAACDDDSGEENSPESGTPQIINKTPVADDFNISGLSHIYDGNSKTVSISPKQDKSTGSIIIYYNGEETAPSALGSYNVTFNVAAAAGWNAASGLSAGTMEISKPIPAADDFDIDNLSQSVGSVTAVTITPKQGKSDGARTIYYAGTGTTTYAKSTVLPTAIGKYTVTFDVAAADGWGAASGLSAGILQIDDGYRIFASVSDFRDYLDETSDTVIKARLNNISISDIAQYSSLQYMLKRNKDFYIDISGSNITSIGNNAFDGCNIASINIPDTVTSIGQQAFSNCKKLTDINIPDFVTSIGESAFYNCESLTSITIPNFVTSIGQQAFSNCTSLASINLPRGLNFTRIENNTFSYCTSLTSITIPNNVTSIGDYAFIGCENLASITIPSNVRSIGDYVFFGCKNLASVTIYSVQSIGDSAFYNCTALASINIPYTVTSIGQSAFFGCESLTSVKFETGSNILNDNFGSSVFPEGSEGSGGDTLKTAYKNASPKAGTYTRAANGSTWTKQP